MSQSGYTPIQLYRTTTAAATPTAGNLVAGELAINTTDEKLYFKNTAGTVKLLASSAGASGSVTSVDVSGGTTGLSFSGGPVTSSGTITMAGTLGVANGGTGATSLTSGYLVKGNGTSAVTASVVYDTGTNVGIGTSSPSAKLHVRPATDVNHLFSFSGASATYLAVNDASSAYVDWLGYANTFQFYTGSTERMRITSAGNVGIGTSSPGAKLDVSGTARGTKLIAGATTGLGLSNIFEAYSATYGVLASLRSIPGDGINSYLNITTSASGVTLEENGSAYGALMFNTGGSERMRVDTAGNLGIGTTSPGAKLEVNGSVRFVDSSAAGPDLLFGNIGGGTSINNVANSRTYIGAYETVFTNYDNSSEFMRIDSSGNVLVGTTSAGLVNSHNYNYTVGSGRGYYNHVTGTGSGADYLIFGYNATQIGSITQNGTTAVAYNTTSDYRLKTVDGPITNSGAYIDALKPVQGSWKADGSRFIGLIAHEVQEVSETQIATGVKDGEEMQAMDYSAPELIANLIAEIQSLRARVAQLEGK